MAEVKKTPLGGSNLTNSNSASSFARRRLDLKKTVKGVNNSVEKIRDYSLPPLPDEDDDLLSHYASPKYNFEPLPVELFPLPETFREEERRNAACFPCFKYYDLEKYTLEEAQKLSAMDLIPKEALKKTEQQQMQRAKRSKRVTADSAHLPGYYRNKNEGVEVVYGGGEKNGVGNRLGAKTRRAQQLAAQAAMEAQFPAAVSLTSNSTSSTPLAKKQGNRLAFYESLRRRMLSVPQKDAYITTTVSATGVGPTTTKRSRRGANFARNKYFPPQAPGPSTAHHEDDDDEDRVSVHSTASSNSTGASIADVTEMREELDENATGGPAWMDEGGEGEGEDGRPALDKESQVVLAFTAHEELGDSDDEGGRF